MIVRLRLKSGIKDKGRVINETRKYYHLKMEKLRMDKRVRMVDKMREQNREITTEKFELNSCTDVEMNTRYHKKYVSKEVSGEWWREMNSSEIG